jgi:tRNA-dihydrouridine synthase B
LRHARKHLSAYAQKAGAPEHVRLALVTSQDAQNARALLARAFDHGERREAT